MILPTLYLLTASNKIIIWNIETRKNKIITTWYYYGGGTPQKTEEIITKTTNGRTPNEQAEFIAKTRHTRRIKRRGATLKKPSINLQSINLMPMLAKRYQNYIDDISFPVIGQPKLDGIRCIASKTQLISRRNLVFHGFNELQNEIKLAIGNMNSLYLDGEFYNHRLSFEEIQSIVTEKYTSDKKRDVFYYVFDCFDLKKPEMTFVERYQLLEKIFRKHKNLLRLVPTTVIKNRLGVEKYLKEQLKKKYEGIVIRVPDSVYRLNYRSKDLLKYKPFYDDEFRIVDYKEGKGKEKGAVIWIVETGNHKKFSVRQKGSIEERRRLFRNASKYIGKYLTVQYTKLSATDKIPVHPVGIRVRTLK